MDDQKRYYIGMLDGNKVTRFHYIAGIDFEIDFNQLMLVDVEVTDTDIKIVPLVMASIEGQILYQLDHDTLLDVVNDALSSAEQVSKAEERRERKAKKKTTKKKK
jgi:CheY-specific phosphatase CheX